MVARTRPSVDKGLGRKCRKCDRALSRYNQADVCNTCGAHGDSTSDVAQALAYLRRTVGSGRIGHVDILGKELQRLKALTVLLSVRNEGLEERVNELEGVLDDGV